MEMMDAHKLSQDVQYALRKQIVRLRKQGRSNQEVARNWLVLQTARIVKYTCGKAAPLSSAEVAPN